MRHVWTVAGGLALGLAMIGLGALAVFPAAQGGARPGQLVPYEDARAVALGAGLYADHCAACHGTALEGETPDWRQRTPEGLLPAPPHDETGHTWHHPDAQLVDIVARGTAAVVGGGYESAMIGFGDILAEDEILAVLAFIKSTWPDRVIEAHDGINADAARSGG